MKNRIFSGIWIGLCAVFLVASLVGLGLVWGYKAPLTSEAMAQLDEINTELVRAQTALEGAEMEIERTLRLVDAAEQLLADLKDELGLAKGLFDEFDETLDTQLMPGMENSRALVNRAKEALEEMRNTLEALNALPFLGLDIPGDQLLADMIRVTESIDGEILRLEELATQAATFAEDISYLMGGDFSETRQNLNNLLTVVQAYRQQVTGWQAQVEMLTDSLPGWINTTAAILTVFLVWFAVSQFGLILHGLTAWRGGDVFAVLRK